MKEKILLVVLLSLLIIPSVFAEDWDIDWEDLGEGISEGVADAFDWSDIGKDVEDAFNWDDIGDNIADSFLENLLDVVNAPVQPLLSWTKDLMQSRADLNIFKDVWAIICYVISILYGLLFLYSGFMFLTSADNPVKREKAKSWLKNIIIMIIMINASYYLYDIITQISSLLTQGMFNLVNQDIFLPISGNIESIGLEMFLISVYVMILISTLITFAIRYIAITIGVVFFPIGLFLYFIEPLKSYGKVILNFLLISIFTSFLCSIILLIVSRLSTIDLFSSMKIILISAGFMLCNLLTLYLMFFAAIKSAFKSGGKIAALAVKYGKYLA